MKPRLTIYAQGLMLAVGLSMPTGAQAQAAAEPSLEFLWPDGAPHAQGTESADKPSLSVYLPAKDKVVSTAVVICPGGGYANLAVNHEGKEVAEWLNSLGITAFVLKYRLGPKYHHPVQMGDVQRAVRLVRARAAQFGVSSNKIGVLGFSAGGHLASTAATHFDSGRSDAADKIDRESCRPDFAVLCYPVISFGASFTHRGSVRNLLGENPDAKLIELLSNEKQVTAQTPPTFLFHTNEDAGVPPENSIVFYLALRKAGVPSELHIYERGKHGVGLAQSDPVLSTWPARCADWLRGRGLLGK